MKQQEKEVFNLFDAIERRQNYGLGDFSPESIYNYYVGAENAPQELEFKDTRSSWERWLKHEDGKWNVQALMGLGIGAMTAVGSGLGIYFSMKRLEKDKRKNYFKIPSGWK